MLADCVQVTILLWTPLTKELILSIQQTSDGIILNGGVIMANVSLSDCKKTFDTYFSFNNTKNL